MCKSSTIIMPPPPTTKLPRAVRFVHEYSAAHPKRGVVEYCGVDGTVYMRTYKQPHELHGCTDIFTRKADHYMKRMYSSRHRSCFAIDFYDSRQVFIKREYTPQHSKLYGAVDRIWKNDRTGKRLVCRCYKSWHSKHNVVEYGDEQGKLVMRRTRVGGDGDHAEKRSRAS